MADIINLRRARKAKAKLAKDAKADANRIQFGRTKAERAVTEAENARTDRALDGQKRERDENEP